MIFLLSLDIGTTSVKAGLFDSEGKCRATAAEEYQLLTPAADYAELDPQTYWCAAQNTLHRVIKAAQVEADSIAAITVSSQGETLITLDQQGLPLGNAIVWMDNRAVQQANYLKAKLGASVYDHTGIPDITPTWTACKILWLKENEREIFQRAARFLLVQDFIIYQLCGSFITDGSISCTTLLFDIINHDWWQPALDAVGIGRNKLAAIQKAGSIAGYLTSAAAESLGLPTSVAIVCGGMDQAVGAIGAGNIAEGIVSETTGAALAIQVSTNNPSVDQSGITPVYIHSIAETYLLVPVCPTAGMAFKWFKDNFLVANNNEDDLYERMNELSQHVAPGCDGLIMLPHLMGAFSPDSNPSARGSFTGFTLHHTKAHFVRSIQEAVAFMLRQNIEAVQRAGIEVKEIRSSGGAARSSVWNQIKADVCALPIITLQNEDAGLVGDAILGGVAVKIFPSIAEACLKMVHIAERIKPSVHSQKYNQFYTQYTDLDSSLKGYFKRNYSN